MALNNNEGYAKLVNTMRSVPSTAIFRRFQDLNMINILRLQAEIQDLERELEQTRSEDAGSGDAVRSKYVTDFRLMRDWKDSGDSEQYDILVNIGEKLQEYSEFDPREACKSQATHVDHLQIQHYAKR